MMEASGVRSVIEALDPVAGGPAAERMRALLDANRPDLRYLVARVSGGAAQRIASICAAVLAEAGAPTGLFDREPMLPTGPLDDALYARAGRLVLSAASQLGLQRPELGELSRREVEVALALTAFAEASLRVVVLVEEEPGADIALGVADADVTVLGRLGEDVVEGVLARLPEGRPVVSAPQEPAVRARIESFAVERALPLLLGGRDFSSEDTEGSTDVIVAGERYAALPRGKHTAGWELGTGIAAALGVGALGVRMRTEWVFAGAHAAARRQ
ncbi:MAG: hypothetical protein H0V71_03585 [Chloroflexi bacterium]|nr:hypothetical protein [Chloroflexota bacterium]